MPTIDVDAANLHLLFDPQRRESHSFTGGKVAKINPKACIRHCRFNAIAKRDDGTAEVDPVVCGVCGLVCSVDAVSYRTEEVGEWYLSDSSMGTLVHARLNAGVDYVLLVTEPTTAGIHDLRG